MSLSMGDKLGPYEILALIGAGGMGEVYRAHDPRLGRDVAIKLLHEKHSDRLAQEARAIATLNHPHICAIHDIGPNYLVMEYIEGIPLKGPLPQAEAMRHAVQIAQALEAAHARGIIHRDLKPANILVTSAGVKLLDFGLAKLTTPETSDDTLTIVGTVMGTAAYMSPEQAQGQPADARSDIFSFGAVLYEMLSGRRAFSSGTSVATMAAVLHKEPEAFDAPPALQNVVSRCLRKSSADRFQSATELRMALEKTNATLGDKIPSIAVLPFANMSADKEQEYFSDGLAEEIINLLAHIPGLKVIARTSAFAFRGKEQDIRGIAETLGVGHVLEGSVRRAGNRVRVTAQLINADDGSHLWSERYDRELTDIFAIQDEIGQAISEALQVRLAPRAKPVNIEAYQNYLKALYYLDRFTPESLAKSKGLFEQALAIDENYALAYSGLATYYYSMAVFHINPSGDVGRFAKLAGQKALSIDPENSEVHSVLGMIAAIFDYDWEVAERHFRKALAANPVPPRVRFRYGQYYLLPQGRFAEAIEQSRSSLDTDPLSMVLHLGVVSAMYRAKQYGESIEYARRALEIDANFYNMWNVMGQAQLHAGLIHEALSSFKRVVELAPWFFAGGWLLATAHHEAGDREHAQERAQKLAGPHGHSAFAARYYVATGEVNAMFEALEGACQEREAGLPGYLNSPPFDPYRADPRFQALLKKMNLA